MYVIYIIDNVVANPFLAWKSAGSPQTPTPELFQQMRRFEVCWFVIAHHHSVGERTKQLDIFCRVTGFTSAAVLRRHRRWWWHSTAAAAVVVTCMSSLVS